MVTPSKNGCRLSRSAAWISLAVCGWAMAQPAPGEAAPAPAAESAPAMAPAQRALASLREMVLQAIMRNPELAQAEAERQQSAARVQQIRAGALAQLGLSAGYGQENQQLSLSGLNNRYDGQYQLQLRVSQPLVDETLIARLQQARTQALGADWVLVAMREQTMLKTVELYAELLRQSRLLELARDNLRLHRDYVAQMKVIARADVGRASDLPVAQSRVALAESVLTSRLARLEAARAQWRAHTTVPSPEQSPAGAAAEVLFDLPPVDWPLSLEDAVRQAIEASPQLQKALADAQASRDGWQVAATATLPKLGAELQDRHANNFGGIFGEQRTWSAGVNLQWNWDASVRHAKQAATAAISSADESVDAQVYKLRAAVESQWYELQAAQASLSSFKTYEEQSQEVVRAYAEQFRIGRRSLLDVLNAENELFTAKSNALTTAVDVSLASWRLLSLRGSLADELGL